MSDKVQLIKQEIERRFDDNMKASEQYTEKSKSRALFTSAAKEDYDLLAFIDSLPEEPKCIYNRTLEERKKFCKYCSAACSVRIEEEPASEDLEEEVSNWRHNHFHGRRDKDASGEYLERESQLDLARHFAEWGRKQMMKDAVNAVEPAVAFWPVIDPDIPSYPYCRKCLDKAKAELIRQLFIN